MSRDTAPSQSEVSISSSPSDYFNLDQLLSSEDKRIRYQARHFAREHIAPIINDCAERAQFPTELFQKCKDLNFVGVDIRGYECPTLTVVQSGLISLEFAKVSVGMATALSILQNITMLAIYKCGDEWQKMKYLPKLAKMEAIGCFCLTEPNAGSDATNLETTATPYKHPVYGEGYLLNGEKRWIGNGIFADIYVVWAINTSNNQLNGFIVERGASGLSATKIEHKIALREVQNAHIKFENVFVPRNQRLPKTVNFATGPGLCLSVTRLLSSWIAVGCAMGAYDKCIEYLKQRKQFDRPLSGFQLVQEKLVKMLGTIQSILLLVWRLSAMHDRDATTVTLGQVSLAKCYSTLRAREVVAIARELLGANGLILDFDVGRHFVDIEGVHTFEGTYEMNALITGKEITGIAAFRGGNSMKSDRVIEASQKSRL